MNVFFGRPFSKYTYEELLDYYNSIKLKCDPYCINMMTALIRSNDLRGLGIIPDKAIVQRSKWVLKKCDALVMDFTMNFEMPVGCLFELAWAYDWDLHVITVMNINNKMNKSFIKECSDIIFPTIDQAILYLEDLK